MGRWSRRGNMVWRIDSGGTVPTLPTIPAAGTEAFYSGGNEATGTPATIVPASWMNMVQEEIRNVVVAAGISPNKNDNSQLLANISGITGGNIYLPLAGGTMTGVIAFNLPVGPPDPVTSGELLSLRGGGAGNPDYATGSTRTNSGLARRSRPIISPSMAGCRLPRASRPTARRRCSPTT